MWSVTGPGIHDELQRLVCWCTVRQVTDVVKKWNDKSKRGEQIEV